MPLDIKVSCSEQAILWMSIPVHNFLAFKSRYLLAKSVLSCLWFLSLTSQNTILQYLFGPLHFHFHFKSNLQFNLKYWMALLKIWKVNDIICPNKYHITLHKVNFRGQVPHDRPGRLRLFSFYKGENWGREGWDLSKDILHWVAESADSQSSVIFPQCSTASKVKDLTVNVDAPKVSII